MIVTEMIASHPAAPALDAVDLGEGIEACIECAQACTACADACLGELSPGELSACIRRNLDCADVCTATERVLSRQVATDLELVRAVLEACVVACRACAVECEEHAEMHVHCGVCAAACRRCEQGCQALLDRLSAQGA